MGLIERAKQHGATLRVRGGRIGIWGRIPDSLLEELRRHRVTVALELLGLTVDELMQAAGDAWEAMDSTDRIRLAEAIATRKMREQGRVPKHYTAQTQCHGCGPVPIFPGAPRVVLSCPWCFNRVRGLPIPRMKRNETA